MNSAYRALVARDGSDWARNTVRLFLMDHRTCLCEDGTWRSVGEGEALPSDAGLVIPAGAVEAVALAISEFQGHTSHADTEARVLREWLEVERGRVERMLSPK